MEKGVWSPYEGMVTQAYNSQLNRCETHVRPAGRQRLVIAAGALRCGPSHPDPGVRPDPDELHGIPAAYSRLLEPRC